MAFFLSRFLRKSGSVFLTDRSAHAAPKRPDRTPLMLSEPTSQSRPDSGLSSSHFQCERLQNHVSCSLINYMVHNLHGFKTFTSFYRSAVASEPLRRPNRTPSMLPASACRHFSEVIHHPTHHMVDFDGFIPSDSGVLRDHICTRYGPETLNPRTLNPQPSTLNPQP